jgi:hypothetical protein
MEIIVDIRNGEDGRLAGTVRAAGAAEGRSFSGNLEFLALVEDFYLAESSKTALSVPSDEAESSVENTKRREQ